MASVWMIFPERNGKMLRGLAQKAGVGGLQHGCPLPLADEGDVFPVSGITGTIGTFLAGEIAHFVEFAQDFVVRHLNAKDLSIETIVDGVEADGCAMVVVLVIGVIEIQETVDH